MGKGGKRVKSCGKVYSSLYIEYIIKEYIRVNKGKVKNVRGENVSLYIDIV